MIYMIDLTAWGWWGGPTGVKLRDMPSMNPEGVESDEAQKGEVGQIWATLSRFVQLPRTPYKGFSFI